MPQCSVPFCVNQGGHKFPQDDSIRMKWRRAIGRQEGGELWKPGTAARVCHHHFDSSDYESLTYYGEKHGRRRLKHSAVPHIFEAYNEDACHRTEEDITSTVIKSEHVEKALPDIAIECEVPYSINANEEKDNGDELHLHAKISTASQTESTGSTWTSAFPRQLYSAEKFDDATIHYYTGLETYQKFISVFHSLGHAAHHLVYYYGYTPALKLEDQFFLTLIKLRTHPTNKELGIFFCLSEKDVSNIFITWVNFMYFQWNEIQWWPCKELVSYFTPSDFKSKFPDTRVIVDGTEFPIKKPELPLAQQATFSTYKNRNTMKAIIGCSPGGLISYVSDVFGGSTSDRQIVERSNLPLMCDPGDDVMADKGFNVDDLFLPYRVSVNIPSFFKKKNRMSNGNVLKDRKIASKRVHIERIIGLAKSYKILKDTMTHVESCLATQIIHVIAVLCNFRKCIVPKDA